MGYFVAKHEYSDGSGVTFQYYFTKEEAVEAVRLSGGHLIKAIEVVAKED